MTPDRTPALSARIEAAADKITMHLQLPGVEETIPLPLTHQGAALLCANLATALGMVAENLLQAVTFAAMKDMTQEEPKGRIIRVDPTGRRS